MSLFIPERMYDMSFDTDKDFYLLKRKAIHFKVLKEIKQFFGI